MWFAVQAITGCVGIPGGGPTETLENVSSQDVDADRDSNQKVVRRELKLEDAGQTDGTIAYELRREASCLSLSGLDASEHATFGAVVGVATRWVIIGMNVAR